MIASVSEDEWRISRTHGMYCIPGCPKGHSYAAIEITSREDAVDWGENRRIAVPIGAREIAEDLLQDLRDHGVFICAGAAPTSEELSAARQRRDEFYQRLVQDADAMWARGHSFREISDLHRRAADALGIEREWAYVPMKMKDCPACGERVKAGAAICIHCRAILDKGKAAQHGFAQMSMNDNGREQGARSAAV